MAITHNPGIVTSDLGLCIDPKNPNSCLDAKGNNRSLINTLSWTVGSGTVTGYNVNETTSSENYRYAQTDPWGYQSIVWETRPSGDGNNDGGWNTDWFNIDKTKLYRFSVWVRRTSSSTGGTFYFGMYGNGSYNVVSLSSQTSMNNPYWDCQNISALPLNQWQLIVAHVYPAGTTYTGKHPDTGYYNPNSPVKVRDIGGCNIGSGDLAWTSDASQGLHRTYHFYCSDSTSRLQFAYPRVDLIDGTQPTITDLVTRSPGILYDMSGNGLNMAGYDNGNYVSYANGIISSALSTSWRTQATTLLNTDCHSIFFMIKFNSSTAYPNGYSGSWEKLFAFNAGGSDRTPGIWRYPSQRYIHWRYDPGNTGTDFGKNSSNQDFDLNTWYYVGVTKNGTSTVMYVNGVQIGTGTVASPKTQGSTYIYLIDGYTSSSCNMGCVHIYNRPLTSSEVLQNFNSVRRNYGI